MNTMNKFIFSFSKVLLPHAGDLTISSQIGPKSNRLQSNRPQVKSAPSQIGLKMKVISAQKNKNKKRINKLKLYININ